jgi:outer membrane protein OmpA-like peptidoglycan-associated protein
MRLISARLLLATLAFVSYAGLASAEKDAEGAKDHPSITRFPGFYIDDYKFNDFNEFEFSISDDKTATKGGKFWRIVYYKQEKTRTPSLIEVIRNYEAAFKKNSGVMVWSSPRDGYAVYRQGSGAQERWMDLKVGDSGERIQLTIVDVAAMAQKVEFSASEMLEALNRDGFVALQGIQFATGKDSIKPESEPLLAEIKSLLDGNPSLRLSVEGHTDNVGAAAANLALSKRRADAVRAWLVGKGVAAARLSSQGYGDTKPVADNRTDAGRAKNRRVELVKPRP